MYTYILVSLHLATWQVVSACVSLCMCFKVEPVLSYNRFYQKPADSALNNCVYERPISCAVECKGGE